MTQAHPTRVNTPNTSPDRLVLSILALGAVAALAIGSAYNEFTTALWGVVGLLALGGAAVMVAHGTLASRLILSVCIMGMVALHIQLGRGTLEFHFGVFAALAILLVYRDWRPLVMAAATIAVHHIAFDRLQAAGFAVYCTPSPDFLKIVLHASYVIVQTAVEIWIVIGMSRQARQSNDLTTRLDVEMGRIRNAMGEVQASARGVNAASTSIASGTEDLTRQSEQAAGRLEQASAAVADLSKTVRDSARSADTANQLAANAAGAATRGGIVVSQVVQTMDAIATSSKRIADINGTIDGIAFQTNILALNAAVEAARAGEDGRGFAVVAAEVRNLAQRSAAAAREIKSLIGSSVDRVEQGSKLVSDAGATMEEIVASVQRVSAVIEEIAQATRTQTGGIGKVETSVGQIEELTRRNASVAQQSAQASEELKQQAQRLADLVQSFESHQA